MTQKSTSDKYVNMSSFHTVFYTAHVILNVSLNTPASCGPKGNRRYVNNTYTGCRFVYRVPVEKTAGTLVT